MFTTIPNWNHQGVIPPVNSGTATTSDRSPYTVGLVDVVQRFGQTQQRQALLDGFLRYRNTLHAAGLAEGFQWLDGSFFEDVEVIEGRSPRDIDVVTFYRLPSQRTQQQVWEASPQAFDDALVKHKFHVDPYVVSLAMSSERLVRRTTYWYSMWSHRRDDQWKGFLQVDLAPLNDEEARVALQAMLKPAARGQP